MTTKPPSSAPESAPSAPSPDRQGSLSRRSLPPGNSTFPVLQLSIGNSGGSWGFQPPERVQNNEAFRPGSCPPSLRKAASTTVVLVGPVLAGPVLDPEAADPPELPRIVRHQRQSEAACVCCDQHIVAANQVPARLQKGAYLAVVERCGGRIIYDLQVL